MAFAVSHFFISPFTFSSFSWKYKEKLVLLHSKVLRFESSKERSPLCHGDFYIIIT